MYFYYAAVIMHTQTKKDPHGRTARGDIFYQQLLSQIPAIPLLLQKKIRTRMISHVLSFPPQPPLPPKIPPKPLLPASNKITMIQIRLLFIFASKNLFTLLFYAMRLKYCLYEKKILFGVLRGYAPESAPAF